MVVQRVPNKPMLIHIKDSKGWRTEHFLSKNDAIRYLRSLGLHFTDEKVFFTEDAYGVIVGKGVLVEAEEAIPIEEYLEINGEPYLSLKDWCKKNNITIPTVRSAYRRGEIPYLKVGKTGAIYIPRDYQWKHVDEEKYILALDWAEKNGICKRTLRRAISEGRIKSIKIKNRVYVESGTKIKKVAKKWQEEK